MVSLENQSVTTSILCNSCAKVNSFFSKRGYEMSLLKQKIMDSALRFFADKGYAATSVQDIANDCGIAKGSFYKFFASKEDLLIEVYETRFRNMFDKAEAIRTDNSLSSRERLIRETTIQFELFDDFRSSIQNLRELPVPGEGKFMPFITRLRAAMLEYYKGCLLRAYGPSLERHAWDFVAIYAGILREFRLLPLFAGVPFEADRAAAFVVNRLDDLVAGIQSRDELPVISDTAMTEYIRRSLDGAESSVADRRRERLLALEEAVRELNVPNGKRAELEEAARLLREEAGKEEPNRVILRALLELLKSQPELKRFVEPLETLPKKAAPHC